MAQQLSGLCEFIVGQYKIFKTDRVNICEENWKNDIALFKGKDVAQWKKGEGEDWRAKTFIKWAKVKVFAAYAVICDVYFQGGKIPFVLSESPYGKHIKEILTGFISDEEIKQFQEQEERGIQQMTDKIHEQLGDRDAIRQYMRKILSLAIYGEAWSKFNVEDVLREYYEPIIAGTEFEGVMPEIVGFDPRVDTEEVPGWEYRSVWDMFYDMSNEDIQKGGGIIERDFISAYELRQLKGKPFYIDDYIDTILASYDRDQTSEGSNEDEAQERPGKRSLYKRQDNIRRLEFWGRAPRHLVEQFEKDIQNKVSLDVIQVGQSISDQDKAGDDVEIMAQIVKTPTFEAIIRFARNDGKRPYCHGLWEEQLDETVGYGIVRNLEDLSTMFNGLVRAYEDNKKLSANVITAIKRAYFAPGAFDEIKPGMQVDVAENVDDVRKALQAIIIPDVGENLINGMALAREWIDTISQIPEILHAGVPMKRSDSTAFEINQLMENAGKYLGAVIRNIDQSFVEPEIKALYDYNMMDPDYTGIKGNWKVQANGFTSFQNRIIKINALKGLLALALSSEYLANEIKVAPHLKILYENIDQDPNVFLKSEEEKQKEAEERALAQEKAKQEAKKDMIEAAQLQAEIKRQEKEDDFQRDLVREGLKLAASPTE